MPVFVSKSREETLAFAKEYAKTLRAGDVVLLDGDMGAIGVEGNDLPLASRENWWYILGRYNG